jgi:hypothetical protein
MLSNTIKRPLAKVKFLAQMKWGYYRHHNQSVYPTIFVACCPKTGSTWLAYLLAEVLPGYHCYYPKFDRDRTKDGFYDVTPAMVQDLKNKLSTVHWHTPATQVNIEAMDRAFGHYLALVRDLRDIIVSIYHFIQDAPDSAFVDDGIAQDRPWNAVSPEILSLDKEACLDMLIEQVLPGLTSLSLGWVRHAQEHDNVLLLQFEEVTQNAGVELKRILDFYGIPVPDADIEAAVLKLAPKPRQHKYRQGSAGNWANELTAAQQARCLEIAGEFLTEAGY